PQSVPTRPAAATPPGPTAAAEAPRARTAPPAMPAPDKAAAAPPPAPVTAAQPAQAQASPPESEPCQEPGAGPPPPPPLRTNRWRSAGASAQAAPAPLPDADRASAAAPDGAAETTGAINVAAAVQGDTLLLRFPFTSETPAAVFRRADMLWLVFDTEADI